MSTFETVISTESPRGDIFSWDPDVVDALAQAKLPLLKEKEEEFAAKDDYWRRKVWGQMELRAAGVQKPDSVAVLPQPDMTMAITS